MKNANLQSLIASGEIRGERYTVSPARYAAGRMVVQSVKIARDGYKSEGAWLAEALGGRWVHRDNGHQLTPTRAAQWLTLFRGGFEASRRYFADDKRPVTFERGEVKGLSLAKALATEAQP